MRSCAEKVHTRTQGVTSDHTIRISLRTYLLTRPGLQWEKITLGLGSSDILDSRAPYMPKLASPKNGVFLRENGHFRACPSGRSQTSACMEGAGCERGEASSTRRLASPWRRALYNIRYTAYAPPRDMQKTDITRVFDDACRYLMTRGGRMTITTTTTKCWKCDGGGVVVEVLLLLLTTTVG